LTSEDKKRKFLIGVEEKEVLGMKLSISAEMSLDLKRSDYVSDVGLVDQLKSEAGM